MTLKEKLERKQEAVDERLNYLHNSTKDKKEEPSFVFNTKGNLKSKQTKKEKRSLKIILVSIGSLVAILLGIIYIPQIFISENDISNDFIVTPDKNAISVRKNYIKDYEDFDFDKDGVNNGTELSKETNVYDIDTDKDGLLDCDDENPKIDSKQLYNALVTTGMDVSHPCQMKDVIMWADDEDSFAHGGVITMPNGGYRFSKFSGWVKFNRGKYAYKYKNGRHTLLNHKKDANAWYVNDGDVVYLTDNQPEEVRLFKIFGLEFYTSENLLSNIFSALLPQNGWVTCKEMWLDDTFIDIHEAISTHPENVVYDTTDYTRYKRNDNQLPNISSVYKQIDQGITVMVSLFSSEHGECIVSACGYTQTGDLLVCEPGNTDNYATIKVYPTCVKVLNSENQITEREYFEFKGAGFDSEKGDTINFFAYSKEYEEDVDYNIFKTETATDIE